MGWLSKVGDFIKNNASDLAHGALDVLGMVPVVGFVADLANAGLYLAEGNYVDAAMSAFAAIPGIGDAAALAKGVKNGVKAAKTVKKVDAALGIAGKAKTGAKMGKKSLKAKRVARVKKNASKGKKFEKKQFSKFKKKTDNAVEQVTIKTADGTKIRVDAIGLDKKDKTKVIISEFKSSSTAPLTKNQKVGFPQLDVGGGTVVGKGKGVFTEGYKIPPGTKVEIVRPPK